MKCEKCGNISWDHIDTCQSCGQSLSYLFNKIGGPFFHPDDTFSWFDYPIKEDKGKRAEDRGEEEGVTDSFELSEIEISDLLKGDDQRTEDNKGLDGPAAVPLSNGASFMDPNVFKKLLEETEKLSLSNKLNNII